MLTQRPACVRPAKLLRKLRALPELALRASEDGHHRKVWLLEDKRATHGGGGGGGHGAPAAQCVRDRHARVFDEALGDIGGAGQ